MRSVFFAALVGLGVCAGGDAMATTTFESGNSLKEKCEPGSSALLQCYGFVTGVADSMNAGSVLTFTACLPPRVTIGKITDITLNFLNVRPEERHFTVASIVAKALSKAFPCK